LLDAGADASIVGNQGKTALMWAVHESNQDIVDVLLGNMGEDVINTPVKGECLLIWAMRNNHFDFAKTLLAKGGLSQEHLNACDDYGNTALILAAYNGEKKAVTDLLDAGADASIVGNQGKTALMWAVQKNNPGIVAALLEKISKDQINTQVGGEHLLVWIVKNNHLDVVSALLASKKCTLEHTQMGLQQAVDDGNDDMLSLFRQAYALQDDDFAYFQRPGLLSQARSLLMTQECAKQFLALHSVLDPQSVAEDSHTLLLRAMQYPRSTSALVRDAVLYPHKTTADCKEQRLINQSVVYAWVSGLLTEATIVTCLILVGSASIVAAIWTVVLAALVPALVVGMTTYFLAENMGSQSQHDASRMDPSNHEEKAAGGQAQVDKVSVLKQAHRIRLLQDMRRPMGVFRHTNVAGGTFGSSESVQAYVQKHPKSRTAELWRKVQASMPQDEAARSSHRLSHG